MSVQLFVWVARLIQIMQNKYQQLVQNLTRLNESSSARAKQAEDWLENECDSNCEAHHLMRQAILDTRVNFNARLQGAIALNKILLNMLYDTPLLELFSFARELIRDRTLPNQYFVCLERFLIDLANKTQNGMVNDWLSLYKELLQQELYHRAFFVLATFAISQMSNADFYYFINKAIPWSVQSLQCLVSVTNSVWLIQWSKAIVQVVTKLLLKYQSTQAASFLTIISGSAKIGRIIEMVYELESVPESGYLSLKQGLYELNLLKGSFCELHYLILKSIGKSNQQISATPHFALLNQTIPRLFTSLIIISKDFGNYNQDFQCWGLTIQIVKVFFQAVKSFECYQLISIYAFDLITQVIIPALKLTQTQLDSFENQNQQFVVFIQDIFQKHQFQTLKSNCAELLEALGDNIDGTTTYVINLAISSLKANLKIMDPPGDCAVISNCQALLILGIFGCAYSEREDLPLLVGQFLSQNSETILTTFTPIQICLLYIFIGYVQEQLFPNPDDEYVYVKYATVCNVHPTTEYTVLSFLSQSIKSSHSLEILKILLERTQNCGYGLIWTILRDFIGGNLNILTEQAAIGIVNILFTQIGTQLTTKSETSTYTIMQCINIVREMTDYKLGYLKDKPKLQLTVWKLFELLNCPQANKNNDDIICILNDIVKVQPSLNARIYQLFPFIDYLLKQDEQMYWQLFPTVNALIIKSTFNQETPELLVMLDWCLSAIKAPNLKEHERSQYLLLIQLLLEKYSGVLSPGVIIRTLSTLGQVRSSFTQPPAYLRLIATSLCFCNSTISMSNLDLIKPVLSINYQLPGYFEEYTKKLISFFLIKIMLAQMQPEVILLILNSIVSLLNNLKEGKDRTKKKETTKKEARSKRGKQLSYNQAKYLESIQRLDSHIKKLDIFQEFSNTINAMKTNNPILTEKMIGGLSEENKMHLRYVLGLRETAREVRKILKVKGIRSQVQSEQPIDDQMGEETVQPHTQNPRVRKAKKTKEKAKQSKGRCSTKVDLKPQ